MKANCIIINRVSSDDQKNGYSLDAQSRHGQEYAREHDLAVVREFTFQESASKTTEQRQFNEILRFISETSEKSATPLHIVVEKKDRWGRLHTRKEFLHALVMQGKVVLHYYREGQILDENCSPEDIFMDDVVTSMNKYTALNIGREAKKGMLEKAQQGWFPHKPPPGYKNNPDRSAPKAIIVDDEERAWVVRMFELRGHHRLSYDAITKTLLDERIVPPRRRRSIRRSYVEKVLKNAFYGGVVPWKGHEYAGKHDRIITPELFAKVAASFQESGRPFNRRSDAIFAGLFRCGVPECSCKITYHRKTKPSGRIYHLYTCANGRRVHTSFKGMYLSETEIFEQLESAVDSIAISDDLAEAVAKALAANHARLQSKLQREVESYHRAKGDIDNEEDAAFAYFRRGILTEEMLKRRIAELRSERDRLTQLIFDLQGSASATYLKTATDILELAKDAKRLWLSRNREERAAFLRKILWNPRITGRTIEYQLQKPFGCIAGLRESEREGGWVDEFATACLHLTA